jgi:hypothetical protein
VDQRGERRGEDRSGLMLRIKLEKLTINVSTLISDDSHALYMQRVMYCVPLGRMGTESGTGAFTSLRGAHSPALSVSHTRPGNDAVKDE